MRLKAGVKFYFVQPGLLLILNVASEVHRKLFGTEMVVTSICDSKHSPGSLHYIGYAADIRTWNRTPEDLALFKSKLTRELGKSKDVDIVIESDHIHIELQPKTR